MTKMSNISQILCFESYFHILNVSSNESNLYYLSDCFQWICIISPIYALLAIISSLLIGLLPNGLTSGSDLLIVDNRSNVWFKRLFIMRSIIVLFILTIVFSESLVISLKTNESMAFFISNSIKMIALFIHFIFIMKYSKNILNCSRLLILINVIIVLILISSANEFYTIIAKQSYFMHQLIAALIIMILWSIYSISLLPFIKYETNEDNQYLVNNIDVFQNSGSIDNELKNEENANFISKILLLWVGPLMTRGVDRTITSHNDLFRLPLKISSQFVYNKFNAIFECNTNEENNSQFKRKSFLKALFKCYGLELLFIGLLKFTADGLSFAGPLLLNSIVQYLESGDRSYVGFYYAIGLFLSSLLSSILITLFNFYINNVTLKIRSSIITSIYTKVFSVRSDTLNSNFSTGEILNFASTDTDRVVNFCPSLLQFISLPIQLAITLYLLHRQLGLAFVSGVVFAIVLIPINRWICNKIGALSTQMMEWKDKRIKLMSEILMGIRVIKMHGWEDLFQKRIHYLREQEVKYLKGRKYLDAFCVYFWATTPVLISSLVFGTFVLMNGKLTTAIVFTSLALLGMLIMPLNAFPWVLNGLMESWISIKRLQRFFDLQPLELNKHYNSEITETNNKIEVIGASFNRLDSNQTDKEITSRFILGPINFTLVNNLFIGIIGKVGSGKSSLLNALVGEMNRLSGKLAINKNDLTSGIAIVSQEAWIQNATVMENILFGKPFEYRRYHSVLDACALVDDIKIFADGDQTLIGDRGVTLSGGQKARISLARAVYQDFDIYLIDDPFASVDIHVAEHIYSKCILGLLEKKSKIICTHQPKYLMEADLILKLDSGQIEAFGSPDCVLKGYANEDLHHTNHLTEEVVDINQTEEESQPKLNEEEREEGVVKLDVYKTYYKSVGTYLSIFILLSILFMQISRSASDCWLAFWTSKNRFNLISDTQSSSFYLIVFCSIAAINSVLTLIRSFIFAYGGVVAALKLHSDLLSKIFRAPVLFFDLTAFGRIINRFSTDIFNLDDALPFTLNIFLSQLYSLLASLIITIYGLPWIALLIIPLSIPYYFIQQYYRWTSRELKRLCAVSLSPIYAQLDETLQGLITIRTFANINRFMQEMYRKLDINNKTQYATAASQQWLNLRLQLLGVVVSSGVAILAVGLHHWSGQTIDAGLVGLALVYSLSVTGLLNGSVQSFSQTEMDMVSVERVMQYINDIESEKSIECINEPNMSSLWPNKGVISYDNVSMRYRSDMPLALESVSFTTKPNEHIGIVGRTGSGKSSLFQVLFRLVNIEEGIIYIDGIDISKISLKTLRSQIFIIPQDPFLFSGSIKDNLDPRSQHSDNEIWHCLKECHLEALVLSIGGLSANISERGRDLSVGQRQLLCLVRALLCRTKILCLDEATASIDYKTEALIQQTIRDVFHSTTILFVAHKIESVLTCDRILVMDNAKVAEIGAPDHLLQNCNSMFYKLCNR